MTATDESTPKDYHSPEWLEGGAVHNWHNHIGDEIQGIWTTFTPEQRAALAREAEKRASSEEWE